MSQEGFNLQDDFEISDTSGDFAKVREVMDELDADRAAMLTVEGSLELPQSSLLNLRQALLNVDGDQSFLARACEAQ